MLRTLFSFGTSRRGRSALGMLAVIAMSALTVAAYGQQGANLVANGGFENGSEGWMWEQWENKPLPGALDTADKVEGAASFKMGLAGATGGRWMAHEIKLPATGKDYTLSLAAKAADLPADAARIRVGIDGKGFLGTGSGRVEIMKEGGSFNWRRYEVPVPAAELGDATKITLFIYHDQVGQGSLWIDEVTLTTKEAPAPAAAPAATTVVEPEDNTGNLIDNGGFEKGETGWQWEQWENKPLPGIIDKKDRIRGAAAFKMGLAGVAGGRYLAKEIQLPAGGKGCLLSFWLKPTDLSADSAYVRLGIEGKGWLGSAQGKSEIVRLGGSGDWKQYTIPISADQISGSTKATLFIYRDQIGQGTLGIDAVSLKVATEKQLQAGRSVGNGPVLTGDTSHPTLSTFALGEKVELSFSASGVKEKDAKLQLEIVDEHDQLIKRQEIPLKLEEGLADVVYIAPSEKLGFYRVRAKLSDGTQLKASGSRKAGFLTYAVVPDPAGRQNFGEMKSRFAMQGGFGPWGDESLRYLGARWVLDGRYEWKRNEPDRAGQYAEALAAAKNEESEKESTWQKFTLPTLMGVPQWAVVPDTAPYMTGVLTPEGEKAWVEYCKVAVKEYARQNPDRQQNIYQITWEPVYPWGFKGRNEDLVRIYELAYDVIHQADPKAVVAGPTNGIKGHEVDVQIAQLQLGLGKYMDMYSAHPYYPIEPEKAGLPREMRRMKAALDQYSGKKSMPMIGTEQGYSTEELIEKEIIQARGLLRQNLITLGEGYRFNFTYYIVDYLLSDQKGYGYYYNLVDGVPWAPAKASPRPIVPAYAAQSLLLDGSDSVGAIEWLGSTAWGYAFQRDGKITLALWDFGDEKREVSLPTGVREVQVYDWMGNATPTACPMGSTTVVLGPEPIYITGVSSNIWGPVDQRMLSLDELAPRIYPGSTVKVSGTIRAADQPFAGQVVLEGEGIARQSKQVSVDAGKTLSYSFGLSIPATANPATTPLTVMLVSDSIQTAAAGARLQISSPTAILAAVPSFQSGKPAVAVTLKDEQGSGFKGTLVTELVGIAGTKQEADVSLAPGETKRIAVSYPNLDIPGSKVCQLQAVLSGGSGSKLTHSGSINFLPAGRVSEPSLRGDIGAWAKIPSTHLAGKEMVIRSPEHFSDSLSGDFRYAWDDSALYVVAEVNDPVHYQVETGVTTWRGDCLQLAFNLDPLNREALTGNVLDTNVRRATELNVALTPGGVETFRSVTYDAVQLGQGQLSQEQVKAVVTRKGSKTLYEIAIPWKELGGKTKPAAGQLLGVAATINDANSTEQKAPSALGLFGGIAPQKEPEKFGLLVLGDR